jgi:hypothetical protein
MMKGVMPATSAVMTNGRHADREGNPPVAGSQIVEAYTATARSWNATHTSRSCSQPDLIATGGNGLFYCFAER